MIFTQFVYLQLLDFLTTIAFLIAGGREGNPLVRFVLAYTRHPLLGFVLMKGIAIAGGLFFYVQHRHRILRWVNGAFALIIVWNLMVLIMLVTQR